MKAGQITGAINYLRARLKEKTTWLSICFCLLYFTGHVYEPADFQITYANFDNLLTVLLGVVGFFVKDEKPLQ
jgi:hypothetical protein